MLSSLELVAAEQTGNHNFPVLGFLQPQPLHPGIIWPEVPNFLCQVVQTKFAAIPPAYQVRYKLRKYTVQLTSKLLLLM